MPGGLADLLDVEGAHALLHAHRARVRRRLLAEEVRLERHHAGVDEQQVRVVEEQRGRRHVGVAAVLEMCDEPSPDLRGLHQSSPFPVVRWCSVVRGRPALPRQLPHVVGPIRHQGRAGRATRFPSRRSRPAAPRASTRAPGEPAGEPVVDPVDGERLGGPARLRGRVDPGRGAGRRTREPSSRGPRRWRRRSRRRRRPDARRRRLAGSSRSRLAPGAPPRHVGLGGGPVEDVRRQRPAYAVAERDRAGPRARPRAPAPASRVLTRQRRRRAGPRATRPTGGRVARAPARRSGRRSGARVPGRRAR